MVVRLFLDRRELNKNTFTYNPKTEDKRKLER